MKGKLKSLLLAAMAVMLFAGCSNIASDDASVLGEGIRSDECLITVGIEGVTGKLSSRTINPSTTYTINSSFQKLVLTGDSGKGLSVNHTFTASELTAKQAEISLAYDKWYLTLTAYDGENAASSVPVLSGNYFVDLTLSKPESVTFNLTPDNVDTVGSVSIKVSIDDPVYAATDTDPMRIVKAKAALYSIENDTVIAGTKNDNISVTAKTLVSATGPNREFTYTASNVAPGRYMFKAALYSTQGEDASAVDTKMGFYSDEIVVAPGRATNSTDITISEDEIGRKPTKPSALKVLYVDGSDKDGFYTARVNWEDESSNEENFILKVFEYSAWADADTAATTTELGTKTGAGKEIFWTSDLRKSGTLGTSTESCELKLAAGKMYDFAIAAANDFGVSDFVKRTPCVDADDVAANAATGTPALKGFQATKVDRVKIEYNLAGGKLELSATESYEGIYVKYETYAGAAITLQAGNPASGETYPKLERSHNPFVEWKNASDEQVITWNNPANLSVTASYNPTFIVDYTVEDAYAQLSDDDVKATAVIGGSPVNCKNQTLDLSAEGAANPSFTFAVDHAEAIKVYFGDNPVRSTTGDSITLDTTGTGTNALEPLSARTYKVVVLAYVKLDAAGAYDATAEAKWYSKVFAVTISR